MLRVEVQLDAASTVTRSRADIAYELIKRDIIRCDLEPGCQVTEEQLAERFGLSRAAVRPALKRLFQQQFVQTDSRQRYVIPPITIKVANDVFEMRLMIEPKAARKAAERISASELERLRVLSEVRYEFGNPESAERFLAANMEFHVTIARASGNELLAEMVSTLLEQEQRLNHLSHRLRDRNEDASQEHRMLVDAIGAADGDRAEAVMAEGVRSARQFVIDTLISSSAVQLMNVTPQDRVVHNGAELALR